MLGGVIEDSLNQTRKKQSINLYEREISDAESDVVESSDTEDEGPKVTKSTLPNGWDGKPIPLWLFKLHGLGKEFKCEICGGASYWGERAYEKHFQEWRHSYGMKCLKIPNTVHFKGVTNIAEALKLHRKIMQDNYTNSFKPDLEEEFEDEQGNILSRREFIQKINQR